MPIEIRELIIRTIVEDAPQASTGGTGGTASTPGGSSGGDNTSLVEQCVEKVLEILKQQKER